MSETSPSTFEELIAEGQALVRSLALRIHRNSPVRVDLDDLIAYGEVGLAEAARDFQAERGNQFTTYAYYRIQGAIYDGLSKMTWTSRSRYRKMRYEQMANDVLDSEREADNGQPRDAKASGEWFARVTERLAVVYLASEGDPENDPVSNMEDPIENVPQQYVRKEVTEKLRLLVAKLPYSESRLIQLVYFEGHTLQDAGSQLGFSKSWASRLHARVLEQLAGEMRRMDLHE